MEENQIEQSNGQQNQLMADQISYAAGPDQDPACYSGDIVDGPTSVVIICKFCREEFDNRQNLERHYSKHADLRPWECKLCDKNFKRRDHLNRHINCVHGGNNARKYRCPYPGCTSPGYCESYHLQRHIEAVHEKLECNMCLSSFGKKSTLEAHLVECHSVDPPFICVVCQAFFFREKSFENHIKRHEMSKPINSRHLNIMYKDVKTIDTDDNIYNIEFNPVKSEVPVAVKNELADHNFNINNNEDNCENKISNKSDKKLNKKNLLEGFVSKPKSNCNESKNLFDPMFSTEEAVKVEINSAITKNTRSLSSSRQTLFGYPCSLSEGPAFNKPTTSLFDELLDAETFDDKENICK